ncbi:hypothetical protein F5Y09DRAFT_317093 [Xylaria sp. FL1042]|nr:hypothetical protein F5Y09DRAFT_317093 [Xylaria sp. FL1042]
MTHLSVLFKAPIVLVRTLLALFLCIFVHLFSLVRNIQHYLFKSRSNDLVSAVQQNHQGFSCGQENAKLSEAWSASTTSKVLFVTIEVRLLNRQTSETSEMALSQWSPARTRGIQTSLWVIENDGFNTKQHTVYKNSAFLYGITNKLQANEISTHLKDLFRDFKEEFEKVYLVGWRINETLRIIEKVWVPPQEMTTIDTERVWQAQHPDTAELSFTECIEGTPHLREHSPSLSNVGNKAQLSIRLLQDQIQAFRVTKETSLHRV